MMDNQRKVVLVKRRSQYDELVAQYNTESQAEFVITSRGQDFDDYKIEHCNYQSTINRIERSLAQKIRLQTVEREFLPNFIFAPDDIILVVGQDGLVANTLKYLQQQPVIAINPDPRRYDGLLLPFEIEDLSTALAGVLSDKFNSREITMARASINDGQYLTAVNDLFIGPRYQISARYEIEFEGFRERQSSSGLIVSTGLGSTGWLTSLHRAAHKIVGEIEQQSPAFAWNSDHLKFAVREPFPSQLTGTDLVSGSIGSKQELVINSQMANHGVIFSDGMIDDFIDFNSGAVATIAVAQNQGRLVVA